MSPTVHTLKTIAVTAIVTSGLWAVGGMVWLQQHGLLFSATSAPATPAPSPEVSGEGIGLGGASGAPSKSLSFAPPPSAPAGALIVPVQGVAATQLVDTFTQARAGGARSHDAIDIMAAEGTPVIAAAPGTVEKLFFSKGGGGITVYVRSADQSWTYYYAHLSAYAPGLAEGQVLARGAPIGFVGHTGDASPDAPHLHFAVNQMAPGERWYQGTPINPFPLLTGKAPAVASPQTK